MSKTLKWQFRSVFISMFSPGESKHKDKLRNNGKPDAGKIYSYRTRDAYMACTDRFAAWLKNRGIRHMEDGRGYVQDYMEERITSGLSAWTVHQDLAAISKVYGCAMDSWGVVLPPRLRGDVHKNRMVPPTWDDPNYADIQAASLSCGLRQHELRLLRPSDVSVRPDGQVMIHVYAGKGGRSRDVVALDDTLVHLADAAVSEGRLRVFQDVPQDAPCHYARRLYAKALYARTVASLPPVGPGDTYVCRCDLAGHTLDKRAMEVVTAALGHARLDVVTVYLID